MGSGTASRTGSCSCSSRRGGGSSRGGRRPWRRPGASAPRARRCGRGCGCIRRRPWLARRGTPPGSATRCGCGSSCTSFKSKKKKKKRGKNQTSAKITKTHVELLNKFRRKNGSTGYIPRGAPVVMPGGRALGITSVARVSVRRIRSVNKKEEGFEEGKGSREEHRHLSRSWRPP